MGVPAHPSKPALIAGDEIVTYGDFDARSNAVAHGLAGLGVSAGDRVALHLPNSLAFFVAMDAIGKLGAAMVPINSHLTPAEVQFIVEDSGARVLLDDPDKLPVGDGPPLARVAAPSPVFYTSGTTGRPKGVVHNTTMDAARMEAMQQGLAALWGFVADDVYILSGPAYHAGPGGYAMTTLFVGGTVVVLERFDARRWLEAVDRHRVTASFMVPAHFIRILEVPETERAQYDLSSLRLIIHGAAPCPIDVKRRIMDALPSAQIWELYGASEGGATRIGPDEWRQRPGSVGTPWPGVEVRILDENDVPQPPGVDGLIYVAPAGGARFTYHGDDEKTAGAWRDDAFTVGDVGHLDADGYLYITDRKADMVIRGGVNIYPREIEEALHAHPDVVDCAVFGIPDERDGEHLKAVVELRPGAKTQAGELGDFCRQQLARFKCPDEFEFVDALPRDDAGKVRKRLLRDAHWNATKRI